jgi:type IV pilus assembly protein PilV
MSAHVSRPGDYSGQAGFTMLEVLVTLFVIAVALLGTAGLQSYALKVNQGGQMRTQAVVLGLDLLERIEANNEAAIAGAYAANPLPAAAPVDCFGSPCTPTNLATYDLVQFKTKLEQALPNGSATVAITGAAPGPWTYTLQINWEERITQASGTAKTTTGLTTVGASGETERFSYTISRTVYNRSIVL